MSAILYDFNIEKGTSFSLSIVHKDDDGNIINLTGYCARLVWKTNNGESQVFITTNTNYDSYRFVIDPDEGRILLQIPAAITNTYVFKSAKYDLEVESPTELYPGGGNVTNRILFGTVTIVPRNSLETTLLDCNL
jgi:hypothetical protein